MNMLHLKIWEYLKDHWKGVIAGIIIGFALVAIIFALPLITVSTETTETEYATEFKQEAYAVNEPYITEKINERMQVISSGFYKVVPAGVVIPFYIDKPDARLVGWFDNTIQGSFTVFNVSNHIIWETLGSRGVIDLPLSPGSYKAKFQENVMWGEDCYVQLAIKWTEVEQITSYQEVIKYRQVPVQVERYKTTVKEERVSVWRYLTGSSKY
jgi:hypothetical protein